MFKVCGFIGISKIELFYFSSTERLKQNQNNLKTTQNLLSNSNKSGTLFLSFQWKFNSFIGTRRADHNVNLPSNSNISKTVRVNTATNFSGEHSISFPMIQENKNQRKHHIWTLSTQWWFGLLFVLSYAICEFMLLSLKTFRQNHLQYG